MGQPSLTSKQLEIMLEIHDPSQWEGVAAVWDTAKWDGTGDANEWTTAKAGYVNVVCDMNGFIIDRGRQTNWDSILAANLELQLDNSSGRYSIYGSHSWPRIRPGFGCEVWAIWKNRRYPLFIGSVSEYLEAATPDSEKITIKAQDAFYSLSAPITGDYNPGVPAERVNSRINRLLTRANWKAARHIDIGEATMLNYATSRTVLDELQLTALSDGGVFFIDNDGSATFLDQSRIYGRARTAGVPVPSFTDDCEAGGYPYAAIEPIVADQEFGNVIIVSNESQGNDSPRTAKATNRTSIINNGTYPWSPEQLAICNVGWVQSLANFQLSRRSEAFYRINSFECYPVHDDGIWDVLLPMRLYDSLFITRTPPESNTIEAPMLCDGMRIEATPESWKFLIRCSPGDSIEIANFWGYDKWDAALWV